MESAQVSEEPPSAIEDEPIWVLEEEISVVIDAPEFVEPAEIPERACCPVSGDDRAGTCRKGCRTRAQLRNPPHRRLSRKPLRRSQSQKHRHQNPSRLRLQLCPSRLFRCRRQSCKRRLKL